MNLILLNIFFISFAVASCFIIIPYVSRKDILFGVSIPGSGYKDKDVINIKNKYKNRIILLTIIGVIIIIGSGEMYNLEESILNILFVIYMCIILFCYFIIYILAYNEAKRLKLSKNWKINNGAKIIIDTDFRKRKLAINNLWFLLYVIIIMVSIAIPIIIYDKLPETLPIHFNAHGIPNDWSSKKHAILVAPISQVFLLVIMYFVNNIIVKAKQDLSGVLPEKRIEQNLIFRYRMSIFTFISGLSVEIIMLLMQLSVLQLIKNKLIITLLPIIITVGIITILIIIVFKTGQSGWKIGDAQSENQDIILKDDDKYWKLGSFYYNPNDPAIFVEKRFGIGWTCNMARPISWVILIGTLLLIGIVAAITS